MQTIVFEKNEEPLQCLAHCGGYYECPKAPDGKRLGPLVGYAGRDDQGRQYVGDVYANFAMAERQGRVLQRIACCLIDSFLLLGNESRNILRESTGFCGAPEGGKALAVTLGTLNGKQYIFPEKKVTAVATATSREISVMKFDRHQPDKGDRWWIVEDVGNNFSTTKDLTDLIESFGAEVCGIICFLNRSLEVDNVFSPRPGFLLPVISLVRKPIQQYRQDDPAVADDIKAGNVVWKPKNEWDKLAEAQKKFSVL